MNKLDPQTVNPCFTCGGVDLSLESMRPEGRTADVWRVTCACGVASQQWSVTKEAAVRAWNRHLAQEQRDESQRR